MTRDFNQQQRDDSRPSFRNNNTSQNVSSNQRDEDERAPRSNRPRLNREMVDRAWENGAPRVHADYQTRSNNGRSPRNYGGAPRGNGQNNQYDDRSSHRGPGSYRPYGDRQDQRPGRSFDNNQRPRPQSFGANGSQFDDRRSNNRPSYNDRPDNRSGYNDRPDNRPGYGNRDRNAPYQQHSGPGRPPFNRPSYNDRSDQSDNRPRPGFNNNNRSAPYQNSGPGRPSFNRPSDNSRPRPQGRGPQSRDQSDGFARRGADRHERNHPPKPNYRINGGDGNYHPKISTPPREDKSDRPLHPRAQTRSWVKPVQDEPLDEYKGNFEGDYEQFDTEQQAPRRFGAPRSDRPTRPRERNQYRPQERHVTEVSDGHVLKGPRPAQRKNAQFWESVSEDTNSLLDQVHVTPPADRPIDTDLSTGATGSSDNTIQTANQGDVSAPANRTTRRTPNALRKGKADTTKPRTRGPKPSQRGFKWPTT